MLQLLRPYLFRCLLLVLVLLLPGFATAAAETGALAEEEQTELRYDPALTLAAAFEAAVSQAPMAGIAARTQVGESLAARSRSLIAATPALQLRHLGEVGGGRQGLRETELGVELPLWRWGQRRAVADEAAAAGADAEAQGRLWRWELAGELRERYADLRDAEAGLQLARQELEAFRQLEQDVARRIAAGDVAPGERLTAEGQRREREAAVHEAEVQLADRLFGWRNFTGLQVAPLPVEEAVAAETPSYPPLETARLTAARRAATLVRARAEGAGTPRLLLGTRRDQQGGTGDVQSLSAQLTLPFGGGVHREAALAPLTLDAAEARDAVGRWEREARQMHHEAEHELHAREVALADATIRQSLAAQELALSRRAYQLGEIPLAERLLTEIRAAEAERRQRLAQLARARAIARFNHVNGVLP